MRTVSASGPSHEGVNIRPHEGEWDKYPKTFWSFVFARLRQQGPGRSTHILNSLVRYSPNQAIRLCETSALSKASVFCSCPKKA
eukprot:1682903-Amphidinium_carterae.1